MANPKVVSNSDKGKRKRGAHGKDSFKGPASKTLEYGSRNGKRRCIKPSNNKTKKPKKPQLPRPKLPISFVLPNHLASTLPSTPALGTLQPLAQIKDKNSRSRSGTPGDISSESPLIRLSRTSVLLTALHRRNKNQHRNQPFYKHFSILRRCINRLIRLHEQSADLSDPTTSGSASPMQKAAVVTAASTRERFEKAAYLRSQRDILEEYVRETIVPVAYVSFSNLVADSQFANLALVLLGILADVMNVVGPMRQIEELKRGNMKKGMVQHNERGGGGGGRLIGLSTLMTGPDQGTVVERVYDSDHNDSTAVETKHNENFGRDTSLQAVDMGEVIERGDHQQGSTRLQESPSREDIEVSRVNNVDETNSSMVLGAEAATNKKGEVDGNNEQGGVELNPPPLHPTSSTPTPQTLLEPTKPESHAQTRTSSSHDQIKKVVSTTTIKKVDSHTTQKHKDKKKRKGNAIDDLFSGF